MTNKFKFPIGSRVYNNTLGQVYTVSKYDYDNDKYFVTTSQNVAEGWPRVGLEMHCTLIVPPVTHPQELIWKFKVGDILHSDCGVSQYTVVGICEQYKNEGSAYLVNRNSYNELIAFSKKITEELFSVKIVQKQVIQTDKKFWWVWTKTGTTPRTFHKSALAAETEAKRLANRWPGKRFIVLHGYTSFKMEE